MKRGLYLQWPAFILPFDYSEETEILLPLDMVK